MLVDGDMLAQHFAISSILKSLSANASDYPAIVEQAIVLFLLCSSLERVLKCDRISGR